MNGGGVRVDIGTCPRDGERHTHTHKPAAAMRACESDLTPTAALPCPAFDIGNGKRKNATSGRRKVGSFLCSINNPPTPPRSVPVRSLSRAPGGQWLCCRAGRGKRTAGRDQSLLHHDDGLLPQPTDRPTLFISYYPLPRGFHARTPRASCEPLRQRQTHSLQVASN